MIDQIDIAYCEISDVMINDIQRINYIEDNTCVFYIKSNDLKSFYPTRFKSKAQSYLFDKDYTDLNCVDSHYYKHNYCLIRSICYSEHLIFVNYMICDILYIENFHSTIKICRSDIDDWLD